MLQNFNHNRNMSSLEVFCSAIPFSQRLAQLLLSTNRSLSPTKLAREFNLRWRGTPVTPNAARKWILGDSIPTLDKIDVLANLLGTNSQWLRWGEKNPNQLNTMERTESIHPIALEPNLEKTLFQDFRLLNTANQRVIFNLIEIMLHEQKK
jgi:hypothetical protein